MHSIMKRKEHVSPGRGEPFDPVGALTGRARTRYQAAVKSSSLLWGILLVSGLMVGCDDSHVADGDDEPVAHVTSCAQLRDHLVELRLAGIENDREQHRRALVATLGSFVDTCEQSYSDDAIACALQATDPQTAATCVEQK